MCDPNSNIIGWCSYCKGSITSDEFYEKEEKKIYHSECLIQMNTYDDSLDCCDEEACQEVDPDLENHEDNTSDS